MVTNAQIVARYDKVLAVNQKINAVLQVLNKIRDTGPQQSIPPVNPLKYDNYTQAELNQIFADTATELQKIKGTI